MTNMPVYRVEYPMFGTYGAVEADSSEEALRIANATEMELGVSEDEANLSCDGTLIDPRDRSITYVLVDVNEERPLVW